MKNANFLKKNLIANRGIYNNREVFENTLDSFQIAINEKFNIYLGVQSTKDGVLIVYHDKDLTRLMKLKDRIKDTTYEELTYLCSYHIPTLEEVLRLVNGRVPIIINPRSIGKNYSIAKELVKALDQYKGKFAIVNRNASVIRWFNANRPDYIMGEILTGLHPFSETFSLRAIRNMLSHFFIVTQFKSICIENFEARKIRAIRENNLVLGYLVDTKEKYQKYKDACDNLYIDNIKELEIIK